MCELGLQELDTLAPGLLTFQEWHFSGPTQGAVRSRMGYADVVHRGAPLYGAGQLLPTIRGGLSYTEIAAQVTALGSHTARFSWPRTHKQASTAEAGPLLSTAATHLRPGTLRGADNGC